MTWKERIEKRFERWATFSVRYRWWLIALMIGLTLGLGFQVPALRFDTSTEAFLHKNDPILLEYNAFRDQFGRDEVILIAIEPPNVFDVDFLHRLNRTRAATSPSVTASTSVPVRVLPAPRRASASSGCWHDSTTWT